jgi:hypothetical protein
VKGLLDINDGSVTTEKLKDLTGQITNKLESVISDRGSGEKFDDVSTVVSSIT